MSELFATYADPTPRLIASHQLDGAGAEAVETPEEEGEEAVLPLSREQQQYLANSWSLTSTLNFLHTLVARALWEKRHEPHYELSTPYNYIQRPVFPCGLEDEQMWPWLRTRLLDRLKGNSITFYEADEVQYLVEKLFQARPAWARPEDNLLLHPQVPNTPAQRLERWLQLRERVIVKTDGAKRALRLLQAHLTDEQWQSLTRLGYFRVVSSKGNTWVVSWGMVGNLYRVMGDRVDMRLCIHPRGHVPVGDTLLAQLLMLKADEDATIKGANPHPIDYFRREDFPELHELQEQPDEEGPTAPSTAARGVPYDNYNNYNPPPGERDDDEGED